MSSTVNQNHFSKMCGVSRQAIGKAIKAGKIVMIHGKVNLDHRITCEYYHGLTGKNLKPDQTEPLKKKPKPKPRKKTQGVKQKTSNTKKIETPPAEPASDTAVPENHLDFEVPVDNGYELPPGVKSVSDITEDNLHLLPIDFIKKLKDFEAAMKSRQLREESRGLLIKRTAVRQVFAKLYTVDNNQLKTLEDRLVPELCGVFGKQDGCPESFKARKMISNEVTKTLRFIKRLMDDFLIKNQEEGLE